MYKHGLSVVIVFSALLLNACAENDDQSKDKKAKVRSTLVTVSTINKQAIEITESSLGSLEGLINPTLAAEMAARVIKVHVNTGDNVKKGQLIATLDASDYVMQRNEAQTEVARLNALLGNQSKIVARNQALVDKKFISQTAVDNDRAQENELRQQIKAARARVASINHNKNKSQVIAPVNGIIESKLVDTGDYLRMGDPIVKIVSKQILRAHLPFPEQIGAQLKPGLTVRLKTPTSSKIVTSTIRKLKPQISAGNRTIDVIVDVANADGWQPGASVKGTIVLGELASAIMVSEQSVVLRPAGEVVYIVRNNVAYQTIIQAGLRQDGLIEILSGLNETDVIAVDGAGFLTDQAPIEIAKDE